EGAPQPAEAERAHALLAWALVHMNRGDIAEAERAADEARTIALDAGLGRELGEAAVILAEVAMAQGRWRERFAEELAESMRMRAKMEPLSTTPTYASPSTFSTPRRGASPARRWRGSGWRKRQSVGVAGTRRTDCSAERARSLSAPTSSPI